MPPRRAAKAATVSGDAKAEGKKQPSKATKATKPASKPSAKPASKPAARSRATKRAAEAEDDDEHRDTSAAPPTKRRKAAAKGDNDVAEPQPKPKSTSRKVAKVGSNDTLVEEENIEKKGEKPKAEKFKLPKDHTFFNPLPSPPTHLRPAPVLFVWGAGNFGQFAMGEDHLGELEKPTRNKLIEQKIEEGAFGEEGAGLESVAAGGMYTLFVDEQGTIWSSGTNDDAALGRITTEVPNPEKEGEFLDVDTLTAQPWPLQSLKDEGFRATRLAAGDSISAALSADGELRVWGSFRSVEGLLGFSNGQKHQFLPVPILDIKSKPNDPERFSSVVAGNNHLVVLTTHGHIYTWGAGEQGQLGRKVLERRKIHGTTPERIVLGTRSRKAVTVGAGNYTSFAVDDKGDVWAWGLNNMGQTGTGFDESEVQLPKKVVGLSKEDLGGDDTVVQIAGGEHHTIFLTGKGKVYACGRSNGGQLGIPEDDPVLVERDEEHKDMLNTPHLVPFPDGDDPVVQISAGIHNNLAVTEGGALLTWGTGPQSELGAGDESELKTPKVIVRKEGGAWSALQGSCGGQHTVALLRKKI